MGPAVLNGLLGGASLGLAAVGVSMLWWVSGQFNLAQAATVLVGAYCGWLSAGALTPFGALVVAAAGGTAVGWATSAVISRKVQERTAMVGMLLSFGTGLAIVAALQAGLSDDYRSIALVAYDASTMTRGGVSFGDLIGMLVAAAAGTVAAWCRDRTVIGSVLRAVAEDPEAARLTGVPVRRVIAGVGAASGAMAGLAGWSIGVAGAFSTAGASRLLLLISAVALIGGAGRIARTLAAGVILGGVGAVIAEVAQPRLIDVAALVALLVAMARLSGLREAPTSRLRGRLRP
ncbi:MAG: ABC transporter permease subunit [Streptosporangiaceae bacterium]